MSIILGIKVDYKNTSVKYFNEYMLASCFSTISLSIESYVNIFGSRITSNEIENISAKYFADAI